MAVVQQYLCDFCGSVVGGQDKMAQVKKTYIQIKGQILVEIWDHKNNRRAFFYVTNRRMDELTFCYDDEKKTSPCFDGFIELRKKEWLERQEARMDAGESPEPGYGIINNDDDPSPHRPRLERDQW